MTSDELLSKLKPCQFCGKLPTANDAGVGEWCAMHTCTVGYWSTPRMGAKKLIDGWNHRNESTKGE